MVKESRELPNFVGRYNNGKGEFERYLFTDQDRSVEQKVISNIKNNQRERCKVLMRKIQCAVLLFD